jgi:predicted O-methyltransferase YrrM
MNPGHTRISELMKLVDEIEGWLFPEEQWALMHLPLMADYLNGEIVEIGSYRGKSTVSLGLGSLLLSKRKRPIYSIDPFIPDDKDYKEVSFDKFWANIVKSGLEHHIIPIKKYSSEAYKDSPEQISVLFIDGDHSYEGVRHDIQNYVPRVSLGGFIGFHDYGYQDGVTKAVDLLCNEPDFEIICDYESLRIIRKTKQVSE